MPGHLPDAFVSFDDSPPEPDIFFKQPKTLYLYQSDYEVSINKIPITIDAALNLNTVFAWIVRQKPSDSQHVTMVVKPDLPHISLLQKLNPTFNRNTCEECRLFDFPIPESVRILAETR